MNKQPLWKFTRVRQPGDVEFQQKLQTDERKVLLHEHFISISAENKLRGKLQV